jgi:hypothetical protein
VRRVSLNRYDARRDANEAQIVKALRKAGVKVWLQDLPDLLTLWAGLWLPLEVKMPKGRLTPRQVKFVAESNCPVVTDEVEALRAVGVI